MVRLVILGEPMGKQRPKFSTANGFVKTYTPKETINYESKVVYEYKQNYEEMMFDKDEPIKATIVAYYGLTKQDYCKKGLSKSGREKMEIGYCSSKNDIDNVVKIVFDALNHICYYDDRQIVEITAKKLWTDEVPKVEILLERLKDVT